jgi:hypothetical protein
MVPPVLAQQCARQMNIPEFSEHQPRYAGAAAADGYAYAAYCDPYADETRRGGLRVFDVRTPSNPVEVGTLEMMCTGNLVLSGRYLYVDQYAEPGHFSHVSVTDISDPSHPVEAGRISGVGSIQAVSNGYAYAVDSEGLWVLDLTDPASPIEVGYLEAAFGYGFARVAVSGTYAYVTSERNPELTGYLHVVDVSDPESPFYVASVHVSDWPAKGVEVFGDYAYVASGRLWGGPQGDLTVVDVSDPEAPIVGMQFSGGIPSKPVVSGRFMYVTWDALDRGSYLVVYDVSDASQPASLWWRTEVLVDFDGDQILFPDFSVDAFCVCGRYVYTVGWLGFMVFDSRGCLYHEMTQERPLAIE